MGLAVYVCLEVNNHSIRKMLKRRHLLRSQANTNDMVGEINNKAVGSTKFNYTLTSNKMNSSQEKRS